MLKKTDQLIKKFPFLFFIMLFGVLIVIYTANQWLLLRRYTPKMSLSPLHVIRDITLIIAVMAILLIGVLLAKKYRPQDTLLQSALHYRYFVAGVFFIFLLCTGINGYSSTSWLRYLPANDTPDIIFGLNREITSDSWSLTIPAIFNQIEQGFPIYNTTIMPSGANTVLLGLPASDFLILARPFYWGYFLFGKTGGLSWHYGMKIILIFLSSYEILLFLSGHKKRISVILSLFLSLSPGLQWWFTQGLVDIIVCFQVCVAAFFFFWTKRNRLSIRITSSIALIIFGSCFITYAYPALQVPLGYLFLILVLETMIQTKSIPWKYQDNLNVLLIAMPVMILTWRYISLISPDLPKMMATVYPAARISTGGNYAINYIFYNFFQWLLPVRSVPWENNCEVSSFLPIHIFVLIVLPLLWIIKKKIKYPLLFLYTCFLVSWLFLEYPEWFAMISRFSFVAEKRVTLVIGLCVCYLAALCSNLIESVSLSIKNKLFLIGSLLSLATLTTVFFSADSTMVAAFLGKLSPVFFLVAAALLILPGLFLFSSFNFKSTIPFLMLIFLCGATINPISIGSNPLLSSPLSYEVQKIASQQPNSYWVIDEKFPYSNYLLANDIYAFNTLNAYEDPAKWAPLDPKGRYVNIYNRYAHVGVTLTQNTTTFALSAPDAIEMELSYRNLVDMGVTHVLSRRDLSNWGYQAVAINMETGYYIYKVPLEGKLYRQEGTFNE